MKILICADTSNYLGSCPVSGMTDRQFHLNSALQDLSDDHDVRFLIEDSGVVDPQWTGWPFRSYLLNTWNVYGNSAAMHRVAFEFKPDIIVVKSAHDVFRFGRELASAVEARLVYEVHDDEAALLASLGRPTSDINRARLLQALAADAADGVVTLTSTECEAAKRWVTDRRRVRLIPTGAHLYDRREHHKSHPEELRMLFLGNLYHEPNAIALAFLLDDVLPALRTAGVRHSLNVVGRLPRNTSGAAEPSVHFAGPVTSLQRVFDSVDIGLCPVDTGAGMKTKLAVMLAAGLPIVALSASTSGFPKEAIDSIVSVPRRFEFAKAIRDLWADSELMTRLSADGHRFAAKELTWAVRARQAETAYKAFLALPPAVRKINQVRFSEGVQLAASGTMWQQTLKGGDVWPYSVQTRPDRLVSIAPRPNSVFPELVNFRVDAI